MKQNKSRILSSVALGVLMALSPAEGFAAVPLVVTGAPGYLPSPSATGQAAGALLAQADQPPQTEEELRKKRQNQQRRPAPGGGGNQQMQHRQQPQFQRQQPQRQEQRQFQPPKRTERPQPQFKTPPKRMEQQQQQFQPPKTFEQRRQPQFQRPPERQQQNQLQAPKGFGQPRPSIQEVPKPAEQPKILEQRQPKPPFGQPPKPHQNQLQAPKGFGQPRPGIQEVPKPAEQPKILEQRQPKPQFGQPPKPQQNQLQAPAPQTQGGPQLPRSIQNRVRNGAPQPDNRKPRRDWRGPKTDAAAQQGLNVGPIAPITEMNGTRMTRPPRNFAAPPMPQGGRIVRQSNDRTLIQMDHRLVVQDTRDQRLSRRARDVYYEELPRQCVRVTMILPDGSRIVTVRNRYGDVVRRSRILPTGRELVLIYVPDQYLTGPSYSWYDPIDLPPPPPPSGYPDYVLTAGADYGPDDYYDYLEQPPYEPIHRIYTLDQVRYSSRLRDVLPRVDLEIHFASGSADIDPSQYDLLSNLAQAMQRILDQNPAETFLIEGHTDAVGSPETNLVLSDDRASAVAEALTDRFGIPPENLVTQGYGEDELMVQTQGDEPRNRRVTVRRITPLVAPVAEQ